MTTPIYNMNDTWNAIGTTFNAILMDVSNGAAANPVGAAASQLLNLRTNGIQRFGVRSPHFALGTDATPFLNLSDIWNTSGVITGILYNVTNTASGAGSLLMDLQIASVSKLKVDTVGKITSADGASFSNDVSVIANANLNVKSNAGQLTFGGIGDVIISRRAAATPQLGGADSVTPISQTLAFQSVVGGTSNGFAPDCGIQASIGTGSGTGGKIIIFTAPAGAAGTTQNTAVAALTLTAPGVNQQPSCVLGNQALATTATDGFLYLCSGAGAPTGVPTAFTGRVPAYIDTTNNQLWLYLGGWKQPKTPAGAALVTWQ